MKNTIQEIADHLEISFRKLQAIKNLDTIDEDDIFQIRARSHDLMMDILKVEENIDLD